MVKKVLDLPLTVLQNCTQSTISGSKLKIETLDQRVRYVQS